MKSLILFLATAATFLQQPAAEVSILNPAKHNHGHQYHLLYCHAQNELFIEVLNIQTYTSGRSP